MSRIKHEAFILFDFRDARGKYRCIRECCLGNQEILAIRLEKLQEYLLESSEDIAFKEALESDEYLQFQVLECLQLAGVKEEWVKTSRGTLDAALISLLLLPTNKKGEMKPGIIVQLNFPPVDEKGEKGTIAELEAAIWLFSQSFEDVERLRKEPAHKATGIVKALSEQSRKATEQADPKAAEKAKREKYWAMAKENAENNPEAIPMSALQRTQGEG